MLHISNILDIPNIPHIVRILHCIRFANSICFVPITDHPPEHVGHQSNSTSDNTSPTDEYLREPEQLGLEANIQGSVTDLFT